MPPWPPEDFNYQDALAARGYRCVPVQAFHLEPELDDRGRRKAFALPAWRGLYRTEDGGLVDVRPLEGKPSYQQLMLKKEPELHRLLVAAFQGQLAALDEQPCRGVDQEEHRRLVERQLKEARRKAAFFLSFVGKGDSA